MLTRCKKSHTLKEIRDAKKRIYRVLNSIGITAKTRRLSRRIERLKTAIGANDGRVEELKEVLRTEIRRYWAKCPAGMD